MSLSYLQTTLNSRLALPLQELDDLSTYLTREWEIYCFAEVTDGFKTFAESKKKAFKGLEELCAQRSSTMTDSSFETQSDALAFYTQLSKPPFGPWVMGARWPHILSSLAAVDELCSAMKPTKVLEVGCGFGFAGKWLGSKHQIEYLGIDFCGEAIKAGRERSLIALKDAGHHREKICAEKPSVSYMSADINNFEELCSGGTHTKKYDLIFSIAGMPSELDGVLIDKISKLLTPNGVIYIHVSGAPGFASRWKIKPNKMELIFEDSLGGLAHGVSGYEHTAGYLFAHKDSGIKPAIFHPLDSWYDFSECMNSGQFNERERNFAYFNSYGRPAKAWQFRYKKWDHLLPKGFARNVPEKPTPVFSFGAAPVASKPKNKAVPAAKRAKPRGDRARNRRLLSIQEIQNPTRLREERKKRHLEKTLRQAENASRKAERARRKAEKVERERIRLQKALAKQATRDRVKARELRLNRLLKEIRRKRRG